MNLVTGKGSGGHAQGDTLLEIENLVGSAFADTLIGDGEANVLDGGAGNDTLDWRRRADKLIGGNGSRYRELRDLRGGGQREPGRGAATGGDAAGDTFSSIENLVGSAFGDTLTGNAGANRLDGRGGADTMAGGAGNDTYVVDNVADKVIEAAGGGIDTIVSSIAITLGADVENLELTGVADSSRRPPGPASRVSATRWPTP